MAFGSYKVMIIKALLISFFIFLGATYLFVAASKAKEANPTLLIEKVARELVMWWYRFAFIVTVVYVLFIAVYLLAMMNVDVVYEYIPVLSAYSAQFYWEIFFEHLRDIARIYLVIINVQVVVNIVVLLMRDWSKLVPKMD